MTRGMGRQSPSNISHYLKGVDFPASTQDLIRQARSNGAEDEVLQKLQQLDEDDSFETMADVMKAYGQSGSRGRNMDDDNDDMDMDDDENQGR